MGEKVAYEELKIKNVIEKIENVKLKIDLGTRGGRVGDVKEGHPADLLGLSGSTKQF